MLPILLIFVLHQDLFSVVPARLHLHLLIFLPPREVPCKHWDMVLISCYLCTPTSALHGLDLRDTQQLLPTNSSQIPTTSIIDLEGKRIISMESYLPRPCLCARPGISGRNSYHKTTHEQVQHYRIDTLASYYIP